jgi:hypothetical protein
MGPTQGYRKGVREGETIWAFPILHLDRAAAFEEMSTDGYSEAEIERWLEAVTQFTVDHQSARLVYFHPPGILEYHGIVSRWMEQTARLKSEGRFRWYTMSSLANFLNARKQVKWKVSENAGVIKIEAIHPQNLEHETWRLPANSFAEPKILQGSATVIRDNDAWRIVAGKGKELQFQAARLSQ